MFKKLLLGAVAASMVASPLVVAEASAQPVHRGPVMQNHGPQPQWRNFQRGQRFDQRYARNYRQIDYRRYRGLRAPPRGYHWVQSGNDAVLVALTTGIIASVIAGAVR